MHRHLVAGALACFGSSLFGQATDNTANQTTGTLNNVQNTLQDGVQRAPDSVSRNGLQNSDAPASRDGQDQPTLNSQTQAGGALGPSGNTNIQNNSNLQNNLNRQPGQSSLNSSAKIQAQGSLNQQPRGERIEDPNNLNGNAYRLNRGVIQGNGPNQTGTPMQSGAPSYATNWQQSWSSQNSSRVYMLRFDASGREFICVNGRPVYFDSVSSVASQANAATQNQYRSGYGSYDSQNGRDAEAPPRANNQLKTDQQGSQSTSKSSGNGKNERTQDPTKSRDTTNDVLNPKTLDDPRNSNSNELNKRENDNDVQTDVDANAEANQSSDSSTDLAEPKL